MNKLGLPIVAVFAVAAMIFAGAAIASAQSEDASAPNGLAATLTDEAVELTWTPGTNPDYVEQWVYVWPVGDLSRKEGFSQPTDSSNFDWFRSNLEAGVSYNFQISGAVEDENGFTRDLGTSNIVTVDIPAEDVGGQEAPANPKPTDLSATVENGAVTLTWTPGSDPSYTEQLVLRREVGVNSGWTKWNVGVDDTQMTDDSVESGKTYRYRVRSLKEDGGKGPLSDRVDITVP